MMRRWNRVCVAVGALLLGACVGSAEDPTGKAPDTRMDMGAQDSGTSTGMSMLGQACGGDTGKTCVSGTYCAVSAGACTAQGVCRQSEGLECPVVLEPVCGCDGMTYPNECVASASGMNVASTGECPIDLACAADDACGPLPPIAPPEPCADGTTPEVTTTCVEKDGGCGWDIVYGMCPEPECDEDTSCPPGLWCKSPEGVCGNAGTCETASANCAEVLEPVCGCDGQTYDNACEADSAGVSVAQKGACPDPRACEVEMCRGPAPRPASRMCDDGTQTTPRVACRKNEDEMCAWEVLDNACPEDQVCGPDAACAQGYFCESPEAACADAGMCAFQPKLCTKQLAPVCGCDGVTYDNACKARAAGVSVASQGRCSSRVCGGILGAKCPRGEFCKKPTGSCNVADGQGVCTESPRLCLPELDEVCGCDGMTYRNACLADIAGVSLKHEGKCRQAFGCGGMLCRASDYCQTPVGLCGTSERGSCATPSQFCPLIQDPVCGCDNKTYGNSCLAGKAKVSVAYRGSCK